MVCTRKRISMRRTLFQYESLDYVAELLVGFIWEEELFSDNQMLGHFDV